jgi:dimethylamine/trimethylamine dehydrogenase
MSALPYCTQVANAYEDEVAGEAFFAALADLATTQDAAAKLRLLARVERATAKLLRPVIERHGIAVRAEAELAEEGRLEAPAWTTRDWPDLARRFAEDFPRYIAEFEAIEAIGPETDRGALRALTRHEIALVAFARAEAEGRTPATCPLLAYLAEIE